MKHRRWTLALVAGLLAAAMSLSACKKEDPGLAKLQRDGKLTVGVELREPFGVQTGSEVTGLDAELAQALCQELGIQAELVAIEPGKGGETLEAGQVQCLMGGVTADDAALRELTTTAPYLLQQQCLVTWASTAKSYRSIEPFRKLKLAAVRGSAGAEAAAAQLPEATCILVDTVEQALEAVDRGQVAAAVLALSVAGLRTGEGSDYAQLAVADGAALPKSAYVIALADDTFLKAISDAMVRLEEAGTIASLAEEYGLGEALIAG